jgi:RHS repeat-associated protein
LADRTVVPATITDGLVTGVPYATGRVEQVTRDAAGRPKVRNAGGGASTATYDDQGRLAKLARERGATVETSYDGAEVTGLTWSGPIAATVELERDGRGRVTSVDTGATTDYEYDAVGRITRAGGVSAVYSAADRTVVYNVGSLRETWTATAFGGPLQHTVERDGAMVLDATYTTDELDRVTAVTTAGQRPDSATFGYDPAGRLVTAGRDGTTTTLTYDLNDNRTNLSGEAATYDARDRLVSAGDSTIAYDDAQGTATITAPAGTTTLRFDAAGTLLGAALPDGRALDYLLDGEDRRVGRMVDGRLQQGFVYDDQGRVVAELAADGSVVARFAYAGPGAPVSMERSGHTYLLVRDHLGSPVVVMDAADGDIAQALAYDADGRVVEDTAPGFQPFGFTGGILDPDLGAVHLGARDYFPAFARWLAPDPILLAGGQTNLYAYAAADPVNRTDRSGLDWRDRANAACRRASSPTNRKHGELILVRRRHAWISCRTHAAKPSTYDESADEKHWSRAGEECLANGPGDPSCAEYEGRDDDWHDRRPEPETRPDDPSKGSSPKGPKTSPWAFCSYCVANGGSAADCIQDSSRAAGDPHLHTLDGTRFDFQGAGEYTAVLTDDRTVEVQVRTEAIPPFPVSAIRSVAARMGGARVAIDLRPLAVRIDGAPIADVSVPSSLPSGVVRAGRFPERALVVVEADDGWQLRVGEGGRVEIVPPASAKGHLHGLFGDYDGDETNDLVPRGGSAPLDQPLTAEALYGDFGESWRVSPETSLFDYAPGTDTTTYTDRTFPGSRDHGEPIVAPDAASAMCQSLGIVQEPTLSACVLDVSLTGDSAYALADREDALIDQRAATVESEESTGARSDGDLLGAPGGDLIGSRNAEMAPDGRPEWVIPDVELPAATTGIAVYGRLGSQKGLARRQWDTFDGRIPDTPDHPGLLPVLTLDGRHTNALGVVSSDGVLLNEADGTFGTTAAITVSLHLPGVDDIQDKLSKGMALYAMALLADGSSTPLELHGPPPGRPGDDRIGVDDGALEPDGAPDWILQVRVPLGTYVGASVTSCGLDGEAGSLRWDTYAGDDAVPEALRGGAGVRGADGAQLGIFLDEATATARNVRARLNDDDGRLHVETFDYLELHLGDGASVAGVGHLCVTFEREGGATVVTYP